MALVNAEEARGRVVLRAPGLSLVWCALLLALFPPAVWLYVQLLAWDIAWFWASLAASILTAAAILRRRVIVDGDRVVIQGAFRRRERSIRSIVQVDLVAYDGFWGWSESPLDDLLNPFAYLDSPLLVLVVDGVTQEMELCELAGTQRRADRRARALLGAIRAGGNPAAGSGTGLRELIPGQAEYEPPPVA